MNRRKSRKKRKRLRLAIILITLLIGISVVLYLAQKSDTLLGRKYEPILEVDSADPDITNDLSLGEAEDAFEEEVNVSNDEGQDEVSEEIMDTNDIAHEIIEESIQNEVDESNIVEHGTLKIIEDGDCLLTLVSKETILKSSYVPSDLQQIPLFMNPAYDMQLRSVALRSLKYLFYDAYASDVFFSIRSAYRSYSTQEWLFQSYVDKYTEEEANRFSARPGQSEHQLGTTVDFGGTEVDFTAAYAETKAGLWLAKNAHRFGFVMSYPEDKEGITGYIFEPWHYRYIGIDEAQAFMASGKTLKEYLEEKPQKYLIDE